VQQRIFKPDQEIPGGGHGKDGKQSTFPPFPQHGCGDLYKSKEKFCCTWILSASRFLPFGSAQGQMTTRKATATADSCAALRNDNQKGNGKSNGKSKSNGSGPGLKPPC
jgi:hypothetical protein